MILPTSPSPIDPVLASPTLPLPLPSLAFVGVVALPALLVLYRRIERATALRTLTRKRILDVVRAEPGLTAGDLARKLLVDYKTASHHVGILAELRFVRIVQEGPHLRVFDASLPKEKCEAALLARRPAAARILRATAKAPLTLGEIAAASSITRSAAKWHVERLCARGALCAGAPVNHVSRYSAVVQPSNSDDIDEGESESPSPQAPNPSVACREAHESSSTS